MSLLSFVSSSGVVAPACRSVVRATRRTILSASHQRMDYREDEIRSARESVRIVVKETREEGKMNQAKIQAEKMKQSKDKEGKRNMHNETIRHV